MIQQCKPELIVDLHNTTGRSSAFSVSRYECPLELALNSFFCARMILTRLKVGSIMDQDFGCPFLTLECGGANDETAHQVAYHGIEALAWCDDFSLGHHFWPVQVMEHPMRVEIMAGTTLAFDAKNQPEIDLCLVDDIENRNLDITPADHCLGWVNVDKPVIKVLNEDGYVVPIEPFKIENNKLLTRCDLQLFMASTSVDAVMNDCLFYVVCL
jgi:hypothetical protein